MRLQFMLMVLLILNILIVLDVCILRKWITVEKAIKSEQLECLLNNYSPSPIPIYAIYAQGRIIPPKIHAFIRFLQELHAE